LLIRKALSKPLCDLQSTNLKIPRFNVSHTYHIQALASLYATAQRTENSCNPHVAIQRGYRIQLYGQQWLVITFLSTLFIAAALLAILARQWPFSQQRVTESLEETFPWKVEIAEFHRKYLPHPGCVAKGVL
jgi:hypothetical protein